VLRPADTLRPRWKLRRELRPVWKLFGGWHVHARLRSVHGLLPSAERPEPVQRDANPGVRGL
jgi:hypothetical protein